MTADELRAQILNPETGILIEPLGFGVGRRAIDIPSLFELDHLAVPIAHAVGQQLAALTDGEDYDFWVMAGGGVGGFLAKLVMVPGLFRAPCVMAHTTDVRAEQFDAMLVFPTNARVVLLADVVSSGALCRKFFAALAPRRVVAVAAAIHLTGDPTFDLRGCPLMAGLTIPMGEVDPVSLVAVDQFDAELLFSAGGPDLSQRPVISAITADMKRLLALHPGTIHDLSPRRFEELIAAILADHGYSPELQKMTRDGGKDIIAIKRGATGPYVVFVQCKRWRQDRPVGVSCVRELHSVSLTGNANRSLLVTTSKFTKDAVKYAQIIGADFELGDFERLQSILSRYRR